MGAAIHFARRHRLGPFSRGVAEEETLHKHLGSLARAGFSMAICRTIIDANSVHDLEELERDAIQTVQADE
jgi:regulatory protein